MSRQLAIAVALLAAVGVLVAAMAWSTAARGQEPTAGKGAALPYCCR